ncbi:MAG: hypothetical protein ACKOAH_11440, partial [Pirellula sp.]
MSSSDEKKDRKDLNQFDLGVPASKKGISGKADPSRPVVEPVSKKAASAAVISSSVGSGET